MPGILSVFNDVAPEGLAHFEMWYNREHLQERVGVPGFRWGRRYELVAGGDRQFCAFYEVDDPGVLNSAAYIGRLNDPTPWTQETMKHFGNMVRTVCDLRFAAGDLIGSYAVMLRADDVMTPSAGAEGFARDLAGQDGIARVQVWTRAGEQTRADTTEAKSRKGGDRLVAGALVVECLRRADADRMMRALGDPPAPLGISGATALGIYRLLCVYQRKK
jgi:hypothetical protein